MYLDQRRFWIWLLWNKENNICLSWKLHLCVFIEGWTRHFARQLRNCVVIGTLFFSCEVAEFLGSVFLLSLFLFWLLIKFQKKENLRKKGNFFWLTVRWCVCCGRGEVWPGKNVGDSCCIRGSRRVRHPVTLLPVKKWDSMLGLHSLPPSFSFTVYGCIVYAHHTAVQGIEKSTLKRDLLPRWNFSTDTITVMPLSWSRWLHILQVDNQDSHWHVCSCRGPELSSEHLCRMTPTVCESTPIGSGAFFWSKCVFNHMCTYPIPFQAYTHN